MLRCSYLDKFYKFLIIVFTKTPAVVIEVSIHMIVLSTRD